MHNSRTRAGMSLRPWLVLSGFVVLLAMTIPAQAQTSTVFTVGEVSDPSCDYYSTRDALIDAAAHTGTAVEIRIARSEDDSLGYTWPGTDSAVVLGNPQTDITLVGGHASCSAATPTAGQYTRLTYTSNIDDDADFTMLAITNFTSNPRRKVGLTNIRMEGASDASRGGPSYGGGLRVNSNIEVTLWNSRVSGFHAALGGGGVALIGSGTDPAQFPRLYLGPGSYVEGNTADNGGGIYSSFGRVVMEGATVLSNGARLNGGGLWLRDHEDSGNAGDLSHFALSLENSYGGVNGIGFNSAGTGTFSPTSGLGGGVYSQYGQISGMPHRFSDPKPQTTIAWNEANLGGGIYIEGPNQPSGGPKTSLWLPDTQIFSNKSQGRGGAIYMLNAVTGWVGSAGGECHTPAISGALPCSFFSSNEAAGSDGAGEVARGGAIYLTNTRSDGASNAALRVERTWFTSNVDPHGLAAVAAADGASELVFHRSIFTGNSADTGTSLNVPSALIYSHSGKNIDFRYNTVLDSNTSTRMFNMDGGNLDATGSILWGTVDRGHPFHFVWFASGGATFTHNGCLLVRASDDGTSGLPSPEQLWAGHEPQLDANFAPRGSSPAIDHCDHILGYTPPSDIYNRDVYDVPGVPARFTLFAPYNFDLGAVEQTDIIYANSFGNRPDN